MTLDDLERPIRAVAEKMRFTEPTINIRMQIDSYYQRHKYRSLTLVSGNKRAYMRILIFLLTYIAVINSVFASSLEVRRWRSGCVTKHSN